MKYRSTWFLLGLSITLVSLGCGAQSGVEISKVSGRVLKDGNPVPAADVSFFPAAGRPSYGTTDASGVYVLEYEKGVPGAVVGSHTVAISIADAGPPGEAGEPSLRAPAANRNASMAPIQVTLPMPIEVTSGENAIDLVIPQS